MLAVAAGSYVGVAQRKVELIPGNSGIPVAPRGLWPNGTGKKLPTTPMIYDTAEGQNIRVVFVTTAPGFPRSMGFLPTAAPLATPREARPRLIHHGARNPRPPSGGPAGRNPGPSGARGG